MMGHKLLMTFVKHIITELVEFQISAFVDEQKNK